MFETTPTEREARYETALRAILAVRLNNRLPMERTVQQARVEMRRIAADALLTDRIDEPEEGAS